MRLSIQSPREISPTAIEEVSEAGSETRILSHRDFAATANKIDYKSNLRPATASNRNIRGGKVITAVDTNVRRVESAR